MQKQQHEHITYTNQQRQLPYICKLGSHTQHTQGS